MRIKHWQGYGSVSAIKVKQTPKEIIIRVSGLHEYGLDIGTWDKYRLVQWLGKVVKFTEEQVLSWTTDEQWDSDNKIDTCIYTIKLKEVTP